MRSIPRPAAVLTAALLSGSLLVGCSGLPGSPPPNPPSSAATEPPSVPPTTPSDPTSADPTSTGSPTGGPTGSPSSAGPPAGTKAATIDGQRLTLNVFPIRRSGTLSVLDFTISRPAADPGETPKTLLLSTTFDDQNSSTGDRSPYSVDGIKLIDTKNRKAYLVASEGGGRCLCSTGVNVISVEPGAMYDFYATFAAPPAAVTDLEVNVPRFGAIPDVPVQ